MSVAQNCIINGASYYVDIVYKVTMGYKFKQMREDLSLVISVVNISLSWKTFSLLKSLQSFSTVLLIKTTKQKIKLGIFQLHKIFGWIKKALLLNNQINFFKHQVSIGTTAQEITKTHFKLRKTFCPQNQKAYASQLCLSYNEDFCTYPGCGQGYSMSG